MKPTIIVAMDASNGIGIGNTLPWYIHEEMKHFRETTTGNTIIMGRNTYRSIGRVLPNRRNIVLTRASRAVQSHRMINEREGLEVANSLEQALELAATDRFGETFIIGGAEVYKQSFQHAGKLIVSQIAMDFQCDSFFPHIDPQVWVQEKSILKFSEKYNVHFFVTHYVRRP